MTASTESAVELIHFPGVRVAVLEHRGDPRNIPHSVQKFIAWRRRLGLVPAVIETYNVFVTAPDVPPEQFQMDLCASFEGVIEPDDPEIRMKSIPAGHCARLRHVGDERGLHAAIHRLVTVWLPVSGQTPGRFPLFLQRVKFGMDVPPDDVVTDIFLPLA